MSFSLAILCLIFIGSLVCHFAGAAASLLSMTFVLLVYHGPNPALPGSDRWKALPEAERKAIYADYAELNKAEGMTGGLQLGLPHAAKTVQVRDGKTHVKEGAYLVEGAGGYSVRVARPEGLEPSTPGLEGRCSIQLSYGRLN